MNRSQKLYSAASSRRNVPLQAGVDPDQHTGMLRSTGISLGAWIAKRLACVRLSGAFRPRAQSRKDRLPSTVAAPAAGASRLAQRGVALVVTLIMLSVITFLAIAFLVLSRREKGAVTTATDQTVARLAAETAVERAKIDLLAPILAFTNAFHYDLRVSTNYINPLGFNPGQPSEQIDRARLFWATNTSYAYQNGTPVAPGTADFAQVVANLFYDPRPPVFVTNRLQANSTDFRFYLDLNRSGRYDTNGYWPLINPLGTFYEPNGDFTSSLSNAVYNFFVGDPEWIGVTERPEYPHSATNRFTSRFAWIAIPAGRTLDINYIHNQANNPTKANLDAFGRDFLRNQGVGSWEINLASFLYDLNTNYWGGLYTYDVLNSGTLSGVAFADAGELYRYRLNGPGTARSYAARLDTVSGLFPQGVTPFTRDLFDGYSAGPLMTDTTPPVTDSDVGRVNLAWPGAESPERFFTTQDFFDPGKLPVSFYNRLQQAGNETSSYDRYTFYRLLSQLGTDSDPDPPGTMNLNYDNLVQRNPATGEASATNFYAWRPLDFFTNAADRMLRVSSEEWRARNPNAYLETFGTNQLLGVGNIPVVVSNRLVYTPAVHRLLQLAANLYDASTYTNNNLPTAFRPYFVRRGADVFVTGFEEVSTDVAAALTEPLDIATFINLRQRISPDPAQPTRTNVYGVPWIVGAKKGLPNFNEMAVESVFQATRKLLVRRTTATSYETNQMYVLGVTNRVEVELWNSYRTNFLRPVDIYVSNHMTMVLTNDRMAGQWRHEWRWGARYSSNFWPGSGLKLAQGFPAANSFVTVSNRYPLLPSAILRANPPRYEVDTGQLAVFERQTTFPVPQLGLAVTNRIHAVVVDRSSGRIIDYVHLLGEPIIRDLTEEMSRPAGGDNDGYAARLWDARRFNNSTDLRVPTRGIVNQIEYSLGGVFSTLPQATWQNYGEYNLVGGQTVASAIAGFNTFFDADSDWSKKPTTQVPFSPTRRILMRQSWQANDPLVHYTPGDLAVNNSTREDLFDGPGASNIGALNGRYMPWGGAPGQKSVSGSSADPNAYNTAIKDPLVRFSDDWDFPTNKYPNLGWIGRVHRGTPWQTVYLKSDNIVVANRGLAVWRQWAGSLNDYDTDNRAPWSDRLIFDSFTTALTESAARGRLSINQPGLAAWSAVFSGVITVTNTMTDTELRLLKLGGSEARPTYQPRVIDPAGWHLPSNTNTWSAMVRLVDGINRTRTNTALFPQGVFRRLGDIFAVPELTEASPFLNTASARQREEGLTDAAYERLPQQVLSLLKGGEQPRFVVYGFGQTLRPADRSVISGGPFVGLCTNYQITAESAIRAVVRVEGAPEQPRLVVEDYNLLPPD